MSTSSKSTKNQSRQVRRRRRYLLTDRQCQRLGPGRHSDGGCLLLYVRPSGSRSWLVRTFVHRVRRDIGLGPYPLISLAAARDLADSIRLIARQGGDPRKVASTSVSSAPTVLEVVDFVIQDQSKNWTATDAAGRYRALLEAHILPVLGGKRVDEVTVDDCLTIISPHWLGRGSLGFRLRHQLVHVMGWAIRNKHRSDNPAQEVVDRLPKVRSRSQPQPSLPYSQVGAALAALEAASVPHVIKLAIPFIVLTAVRLREATEAQWSEFDLQAALWTIPKHRMKKRREHRVPLSSQALSILADARDSDPSGSLVFGYRSGRRRPRALGSGDISEVLHGLKFTDGSGRPIVMHGFRSTFMDWVEDHFDQKVPAAEAALAHQPGTATEKSYRRKDMLKPRGLLMQNWADYVFPGDRS